MDLAPGAARPRGRTPLGRALANVVDLRPGEARVTTWAFATFFCLLTAYYVLRPVREQFAVAGGMDSMPWLFTGTFAATLVAVPLWSALAARVRRRLLLPLAFQFFVASLVGFFFLLRWPAVEAVAARAFFMWLSVFVLLVVSMLWSLLTDVFTQAQGKRLFGFIAAGGSAGALLGPILTTTLVERVGPLRLLLVSAGMLELAALGVARIGRASAGAHAAQEGDEGEPQSRDGEATANEAPVGGGALGGVRAVFTSRYLLLIAAYQLLITLTGTFGYFLQAQQVGATLVGAVARTRYFAQIDLAANVLTLVVQAVVTGRFLTRLGLRASLLMLPPLTAAGFCAVVAAPLLMVVGGLHVLRRAAVYALANPTRDVLFTVTSREDKYKARAFIDTVVYRGGDTLSGWGFTGLSSLGIGVQGIAGIAAAVALPWMVIAAALARHHARLAAERDAG